MTPKRISEAQADEADVENQRAVVTEHAAMDRRRTDEIENVLDADRETLVGRLALDDPPGNVVDEREAWDEAIENLAGTGEESIADAMATKVEKLTDRAERGYPSLLRLRFRPEEPFEFVPGQYARISYEEEEPRVYSIASSPNRDEIELCIRRVPGGELTPDLCDETVEGDELFVRGPYGDEFMLQDPSERDLVFIATGTGAAPFKSMIECSVDFRLLLVIPSMSSGELAALLRYGAFTTTREEVSRNCQRAREGSKRACRRRRRRRRRAR